MSTAEQPSLLPALGTRLADAVLHYARNNYTQKLRPGGSFNDHADFGQPWSNAALRRFSEADQFAEAIYPKDSFDPWQVEQTEGDIEATLAERAERRRVEHRLATYMKRTALHAGIKRSLAKLIDDAAERMFLCRTDGCWGQADDGSKVIAWTYKCGSSKLCPDGSRENTRRIAELYVPVIDRWKRAGKDRRVFYAVFTTPNAAPGELADGNRDIQKRFREFLSYRRPIRDAERAEFGYSLRTRNITHWQPARRIKTLPDAEGKRHTLPYAGPGIHGALTQLECPLSARGDWNVHLNALLLVDGRFDYEEVRRLWGCNVHLEEVEGGEAELVRSLKEIVKYAARMVAEKSAQHAADGQTRAPAMEQWPPERFAEWFGSSLKEILDKNQKVRWIGTRWFSTYGALYGITAPESEPRNVQWYGSIKFTDAGAYWVGSTRENNFSASLREKHHRDAYRQVPGYRIPHIRPPPGS